MGLSRPCPRPVRARRRRLDLVRSSSAAGNATRSGVPAAASPCSSCPGVEAPPATPAPPLLPATPSAGYVNGSALQDVGEVVPDASPQGLSAAPAAKLAADAMLGHQRSDPAIGGRQVRRSPPPKPAAATASSQLPTSSTAMAALGSSTAPVPRPPPRSSPTPAQLGSRCCSKAVADGVTVVEAPQGPRAASKGLLSSGIPLQGGSMVAGSWATVVGEVDDSDEEKLAPMTPPAMKSSPPAAQLAQSGVGCEADTSGGWQKVLHRRGPRSSVSPSTPWPRRPIPAWLHGRCCRCLALGHRAAVCRDPLRCSHCLENGHRARDCRNQWRPLSSMACLVAPPGPHHGIELPHAPTTCKGHLSSAPPSKNLHCGSWASVVSAPADSVPSSNVVLLSTLAALAEQLQGCLARVESFMERAEVALCKLSLVPSMLMAIPSSRPLGDIGVGSAEDMGGELYGCYSPRVGGSSVLSPLPSVPSAVEDEAIAVAVAPVQQSMPELQEHCVSSALPLSVEHMNVDSSVILSSPERSEVAFTPIPPPSTHDADVLFAKELCSLLSSVEAAMPGSGRAIACLLTGSTIKGKNKKASKVKKGGAIWKASVAA